VNGVWHFDSCGNCSKVTESGYSGSIEHCLIAHPSVMSRDDYFEILKERGIDGVSVSCTGVSVPTEKVKCFKCGKRWTMNDAHNFVAKSSQRSFLLDSFVGKTFEEARDAVCEGSDMMRWTGCEVYRAGKSEGIDNQSVVMEGDEIQLVEVKMFHPGCNRLWMEMTEKDWFRKVFEEVGFDRIALEAIPNGYCPCDVCAPWFIVTTEIGDVKIGWRKRVIEIDWSEVYESKREKPKWENESETIRASVLFHGEDVTKGKAYIHAWSKEKAVEYLRVLKEKAGLT